MTDQPRRVAGAGERDANSPSQREKFTRSSASEARVIDNSVPRGQATATDDERVSSGATAPDEATDSRCATRRA